MRKSEQNTEPKSDRKRSAAIAGGILLAGLTATALKNCETDAPPENQIEKLTNSKAPNDQLEPKIPRSLGCQVGTEYFSAETDPVKLQYQYSYRLAQCVEKKSAEAGLDSVCDPKLPELSIKNNNQYTVECISYDDDGFPSNKQSLYVGPVCSDLDFALALLSHCEDQTFAGLATNMRLTNAYYGTSWILESFTSRKESLEKQGFYLDIVSTSDRITDLEKDLETLCEQTVERMQEQGTTALLANDLSRGFKSAEELLTNVGIDVEAKEDSSFYTDLEDLRLGVRIFGSTPMGEEIVCSQYSGTSIGTQVLSCTMPHVEESIDGEYLDFAACRLSITASIDDLEKNPSALERMAQCDPVYKTLDDMFGQD